MASAGGTSRSDYGKFWEMGRKGEVEKGVKVGQQREGAAITQSPVSEEENGKSPGGRGGGGAHSR